MRCKSHFPNESVVPCNIFWYARPARRTLNSNTMIHHRRCLLDGQPDSLATQEINATRQGVKRGVNVGQWEQTNARAVKMGDARRSEQTWISVGKKHDGPQLPTTKSLAAWPIYRRGPWARSVPGVRSVLFELRYDGAGTTHRPHGSLLA